MLALTTTTISDQTLLLASRLDEQNNKPVLVLIDWLNQNDWQDSKSIEKVKKHYKLADDAITFKDQNSLSAENPNEVLLLATIAQLDQYLTCERQYFTLPLDTSTGTPFQQKVWHALQQIPYGQTISYSELAKNIDQPTAQRAVASANGKNPFSIIIPCHRVIASDGGLGGYTGGLDKKEALLAIEGLKIERIN